MKLNLIKLIILMLSFKAAAQISVPQLNATQKYTVLAVNPNSNEMSTSQIKLIDAMKNETNRLLEPLSISIARALGSPNGIQNVFVNMGNSITLLMKDSLNRNLALLPEEALYFTVYVLPWDKMKTSTLGTSPLLGSVQQMSMDLSQMIRKNEEADFYDKINSQIRNIKIGKADQFQLQAIALQLKLEKNNSSVKIQILGRLKQSRNTLIKSNDQVHFTSLDILGGPINKPMALTTIEQNIQSPGALPSIFVEFGEFGGISGGYSSSRGSLQIASNPWQYQDCQSKLNSTPAFVGTLGAKAAGNNMISKLFLNKIVTGMPVKFRILQLSLDPKTAKISKMNLAMEVGKMSFPKCMKSENVNAQFTQEANAAIESQISSLYKQDDMTKDLMNALYR